jgi:polyphosphate kinase 2 (PPK2 family)
MLEIIDLSQSIDKREYKKRLLEIQTKLFFIQRDAVAAGLPIILVFEGWESSGKGSAINALMEKLDPRRLEVSATHEPNIEEMYRPFMWRFWVRFPAKGEMKIFDQSWYRRVLEERVEKIVPKKVWRQAYEEINQTERQLVDDGTLIIKFWLHISAKEQKKRFKKMAKDPYLSWKVGKREWKMNKKYPKYQKAVEEMLQRTSTTHAPWQLIPCQNLRFGTLQILETIYEHIAEALQQKGRQISPIPQKVLN